MIMEDTTDRGQTTTPAPEYQASQTNHPNKVPQSSKRWNAWTGLLSLVVIGLCAAASAIVVGVSNDQEVSTWKISPAVWLAIFSAGSNVAFGSALATGIAVRFWLHASEAGGAQLSQLHYVWDHGRGIRSFFSALRAGPTARTVAIMATLAYILQFASGPLLQRSTKQASELRYDQQLVSVDLASRIPDGWFGTNSDNWDTGSVLGGRKAMSQAQQWYLNSTIAQPEKEGYRCDGGTCEGYARGAGFTHSCNSSTSLLDMSRNETAHHAKVFSIDADRIVNSTGHTVLQVIFSHIYQVDQGCQATINTTICNITAAIMGWPVSITNSTLSLRLPEILTTSPPNIISLVEYDGDRYEAPAGAGVGLLAGLHKFVDDQFYDEATIKLHNGSKKWLYSGPGPGVLADVFFHAEPWNSDSSCELYWASPVEHVLQAMYDFIFRAAMRVGRDSERQNFFADKARPVLVFQSEWGYLAAALVVIAVGLGLVASLIFWGNWRLESPVTLSPLETATLFVNHPETQDSSGVGEGGGENISLRQVLRPGARIDEILADARRMDIRIGAPRLDGGEGSGTELRQVKSNLSARQYVRRSTWK